MTKSKHIELHEVHNSNFKYKSSPFSAETEEEAIFSNFFVIGLEKPQSLQS